MVVDRRRRETLFLERPLPGEDIALEEGRDAVVPVALGEERDEAIEMGSIGERENIVR